MHHTTGADARPQMNSAADAAAPAAAPLPPESGAHHDERARMIDALRAQALQRSDPMAANIEMLSADLVVCATRVFQSMASEDPATPITSAAYQAFERKAELSLKFTRQIDRFAQILRQPAAPKRPNDPCGPREMRRT